MLDDEGEFRGFDAIIGNPPYGIGFTKSEKGFFNDNYNTIQYNYESYSLFHEKSISLLKEKGFISFIVPNTFLVVERGEIFRQFFYFQTKVLSLVETLDVFGDAVVETLIYLSQKEDATFLNNGIEIKTRIRELDASDFSSYNSNLAYKANILSNASLIFNYRANDESLNLYDKLLRIKSKVSTYCSLGAGVKLYEVGKGTPAQTKETLRSRPYNSFTKLGDDWLPLIKGGNIRRYSISWDGEFVKYGDNLSAPRKHEIFLNEKIFIRRTDDNLMACIDNSSMIGVNSVHVLKSLDKSVILQFILAILNSKLLNWYFRFENFHMVGKPLAEVKLVYVQRLPLLIAADQTWFINLVDQVLKEKKENPTTDTSALEAEIDQLVYQLYGLTEEEIQLVEESVR